MIEEQTVALDEGNDTGYDAGGLVTLSDETTRKLPDDVAAKRALRADYGLGEHSPGRDALSNAISTGNEQALRQTASAADEMKQTAANARRVLGVVSKQTPVTQDDVDLYKGSQVANPIDPGVVFELGFGKRIVNDVAANNPDTSSVFSKGVLKDPAKTYQDMDIASDVIAKQSIADTLLENRKADWKATSWWDSASDLAESFVPLLSASRLRNVAGVDGGLLPGDNLEAQVQGLLLKSPSEFKKKLEEVTDALYDKNPQDAIKFLEAVKSYGADDRHLDSLFGIADVLGIGEGLVGVGKLVAKGTKLTAPKLATETAVDLAGRTQRVQALKDTIKASSKNPDTPEDIFAAVGQIEKAADIGALRKLGVLPTAGMTDAEVLARNLPSAARVQSIVSDAGTLSREATDRLASKLNANLSGLDGASSVTVRNTRLTPEQLEVGIAEAKEALRREFEKTSDSIIDVRHNVIENNTANVETVTLELGAPNATPWPSEDLARFHAEQLYGLEEGAYNVKQIGDNFTLEITRPIDETTEGVRKVLQTSNPDSAEGIGGFMDFLRQPNKVLPGYLKGADESLPEFQNQQRKAVQFGFNSTLGELKEVVKPLATLGKKELSDLETVLKYNRDAFDSRTGDRGFFYSTVADLEEGYLRSTNRLPSEKEIEAYFTYTQLSDLDWGLRNTSLYRDKARLGLKQYSVEFQMADEGGTYFPRTPNFEGRSIDNLPWGGEPATVLHFENNGKSASVFTTKEVDPAIYEEMIKNGGYKVIQVDNPVARPFSKVLNNNEVIQYVLTKEFKESELSLKQLDYNPGGHVEYQHDWFLKQPRISVGRGGQRFYEGDTALLNFTSEAQTRKFEKSFNTARELLKAKDEAGLEAFVSKNLPYTKDQFKAMFEGAEALSLDQKFHVVKRGRSIIQDNKAIRQDNPGIRDYTDSVHNISGEANRKYVGARNGPLMTVHASGSDSNPLFRMVPAKTIDPIQTMGKSLANAVNNRFFGDYKTGAVEDFISRYADAMKTPIKDLQAFPMYFLHNPEWDVSRAGYGKVAEAMNARRAIMNFVGEQTPLGRQVENMKQKLYNSVFNTFGQDATTKVVNVLGRKGDESIDPSQWFRAVGFHTKLGLFNPMQYPLQAMGATHAIAISPKHGLNAAISYFPTRWLGLHPSEELIKATAQKMKSFGWVPEHFEESIKTMRQVGYDNVGREHVWKDNISDPKIFGEDKGGFLDKGSFFFNEGERTHRIIAWHTAYREWKEANPLKKMDTEQIRSILNRADLMGTNMSRASAASWQKGLLSIPTQFLGYQARMMDQFLGKRLTTAEKTRAFAVYSTMYGVPSAIAGATGYTAYEDIRTMALEKGWNVGDPMFKALHEGAVSSMLSLISGKDYNYADRYGPGGLKILKEIANGDKSLAELAGGASGSILGNVLSSGSPLLKDFYTLFNDGGSFEPVLQDVVEATKNISSVNSAAKILMALNTAKYFNKQGKLVGDMSPADAIFGAITGLQPQRMSDMSLMYKSGEARKEVEENAYKEMTKNWRLGVDATARGDREAATAFYKKSRAALIAADINVSKQGLLLQRFLKDQGPMIDRAEASFVNNAPGGDYNARNTQRMNRQ